jgi:8-oxo-dGTP diphosphatase
LPGGAVGPDETLEQSVRRHLAAKVDVREMSYLEQLRTVSDPLRHPGPRLLATAYLGLVPSDLDPVLVPVIEKFIGLLDVSAASTPGAPWQPTQFL